MSLYSFRDLKGGNFFLDSSARYSRGRGEDVMPFLRFVRANDGAALDLWEPPGRAVDPLALLSHARLDWEVDSRPVLVPIRGVPEPIRGYQVLVRPDTDKPMAVVTTAYKVAENVWVAEAAMTLARAHNPQAHPLAAVGFGKNDERTLLAVRVEGDDQSAVVLLAYNTHGEGAIRFQLVEADRSSCAVLVPDLPHAALSVPHVGDVEERLRLLRHRRMVEQYMAESREAWERLSEALWTPKHTQALIGELWPQKVEAPRQLDGLTLTHPQSHLTRRLGDCTDAATAFRRVCGYLDNDSEAREQGDFTKDRDERLTLGAGLRYKQRAWQWITQHLMPERTF